jgi:hypothetical protein
MTSIDLLLEYPLLDGDDARRAIWLVDVPLAATHRLRNEVNHGKPIPNEVLDAHDLPVIASLLKLYLLQLPDSLVSSNLYEIMKTIYSNPTTTDPSSTQTRISVLQNALGHGQLPLANIATLDAVTSHFVRLIDLTSADEAYITQLAQSLAPCILRPRIETNITSGEKYNYRFLRDLFEHHKAIFDELKRAAAAALQRSLTVKQPDGNLGPSKGTGTVVGRPRAISSDESNRRTYMEERARAIASRSRASSPSPFAAAAHSSAASLDVARHRRDSSKGPGETRFPIAVSTASPRGGPPKQSLDIPKSEASSPVRERERPAPNGLGEAAAAVLANHNVNAGYRRPEMNGEDTYANKPRLPSLSFASYPQQQASDSISSLSTSVPMSATSTGPPPSVLAGPMPGQQEPEVEKKNSLGRSTATAAFRRRPGTREGSIDAGSPSSRSSIADRAAAYGGAGFRRPESLHSRGNEMMSPGGMEDEPQRGVQLVDKPMDDD